MIDKSPAPPSEPNPSESAQEPLQKKHVKNPENSTLKNNDRKPSRPEVNDEDYG